MSQASAPVGAYHSGPCDAPYSRPTDVKLMSG